MSSTPLESYNEELSGVSYKEEITQEPRLSRRAKKRPTKQPKMKKTNVKVPFFHHFYLLVFSLIISLFSVVIPFFSDFANGFQSQNLYTGFMITQGQLPYTDLFATGGFLYYLTISLSYLLGSELWLLIVQIASFYISGIYLYKIVLSLSQKKGLAVTVTSIFYLLNVTLGFGGLYPIQLSFLFFLPAMWFLLNYFKGQTKDEGFIVYGVLCAFAILFDSRNLLFGLVALIVLSSYNLAHKYFARGFYQLLCLLFGLLLVFYTVGFLAFNMQVVVPYLQQTVVYPIVSLTTSLEALLYSFGFYFIFSLGSGVLLGVLLFPLLLRKGTKNQAIKWVFFLSLVLYFILVVLTKSFETYHVLPMIPFGLILTILVLNRHPDEVSVEEIARSRHRQQASTNSGFKGFSTLILKHLLVPILIMGYGLGLPIYHYLMDIPLYQEREMIANYIATNTSEDESIYVWDNVATIYQGSQRQSSSHLSLPLINTSDEVNQKRLEDELLQNKAKYFVLNNNLELPQLIKSTLDNHYQPISFDNIDHLTVYQLNP
ncbi:DUF2079 domain-containing protein [Streptococcus sp. CSL10205-OR2]|uniref:DUF2079 domain-containing protein n=1 Tax=Streptococcus sp. CSL10205-OR2 TaxID=2980558 RepID=UPI0021D88689|nr:DUF2079 domain-containing protein [Streptococcus sp. CSL10205-OR2]MCU9533799.1 DUF2079 domain-containing protein [Streptococcus sp. CSL10205-OR2]